MLRTQVLIIGGGATGTGLARDLALRGIQCVLVEKGDINAGASGANHGYLHSGARYVYKDIETSKECYRESLILKKMAPHCIEETGGFFVAVEGDDEGYAADFPNLCSQCGIPVQAVDIAQARELEPALSDKSIAVFATPEAAINPFRLSCENMTQAMALGAICLRWTKVVGFTQHRGKIRSTTLMNVKTGQELTVEADQVVSASGAWAGEVSALLGIPIHIVFSKGTLIITEHRIAQRVIMRLRPPSDADALIPGGSVSILGTSSIRVESPDDAFPTVEEVDHIMDEGARMIPLLEQTRVIRAYAGIRPLIRTKLNRDDRDLSRDFVLFDHSQDGVDNFISITGGKLTTYRLMAERAADLVCTRLGISTPCLTQDQPLPSTSDCHWTEPALAPKLWAIKHDPADYFLCECEMVPASAVDNLLKSIQATHDNADLSAIANRSRVGRGPCQGTFCGIRVTAHLYNQGMLKSDEGLKDLKNFLEQRWKGHHPVLWDVQLQQGELEEALHAGLFGLELLDDPAQS